ncbi:MAG TPA: vWA domain-containing protein, partial [Actinomycetota bacterium]|nr:vWA domain-containing protein [Actinomycetota bacterium]
RALQAVKLRGSNGGTDMQAGIKLAVSELAGLVGSTSEPRPAARKVMLLLTDGLPSLPFGQVNVQDPQDIEATVAAGNLAAEAGVLINVFGLGPAAGGNDRPQAVTEIARLTSGRYVAVRRPGDVVTLLSGISFAAVEDVVAVNLTIGQESGRQDIVLMPDGSFRGFVPVAPGLNRIRVSALASDGTRGSTEFQITYRLQDLSDSELQAELERVRDRNRDIEVLTERRRQDAFRRSERERALTLEVEGDTGEPESKEKKTP